MKMLPPDLRARLRPGGPGVLSARDSSVRFDALIAGNPLSADLASLDGAHVLLRTADQLTAALALIALDGIAARIVIAPPDLKEDFLGDVIRRAEIDTLVTDSDAIEGLRSVEISTRSQTGRCDGCKARQRMGDVHLRHHRRAQDGGAYAGRAHRRDQARRQRCRVGHFLRHTPLWRAADFSARGPWRRFADFIGRGRIHCRFSGSPGPWRRHASDRHAVALAPGADEPWPCARRAQLRSPVG